MQKYKKVNVFGLTLFHLYALVSLLNIFEAKFLSILWIFVWGTFAGLGVTAGVHRLWTHRSYKATDGFRIFLAAAFSASGQNTIYDWVRDHRTHHQYSDTDADPHNISRGFWFSHIGWLMMTKHPEVIEKGKKIHMDDILSDTVVQFHQEHFTLLKFLLCFLIPTLVPIYCWGESVKMAIATQVFIRYALVLNFTWSVNSFAHLWGNKPYNPLISPCENKFVSYVAIGEGWHNYHHTYPYDYKASEFGVVNFTTRFLLWAKKHGLIYDCKEHHKF